MAAMVRGLTDLHRQCRLRAHDGHVDDRNLAPVSSCGKRGNDAELVVAAFVGRFHHEADRFISARERDNDLAPVPCLRDAQAEGAVGLCIHRVARVRYEFADERVSTEFLQEVACLSNEESVLRELTDVRYRVHIERVVMWGIQTHIPKYIIQRYFGFVK